MIVSSSFVTPEHNFYKFNGYSHPSEWLAFMEWLFKFEYDSDGKLIACREFEVVNSREGTSYIIFGAFMIKVEGLDGLFQILNNQIKTLPDEKKNPFQSWISSFQDSTLYQL